MRGFEDQPIDWAPASVWMNAAGVRHQSLEFIVPGLPVPKGNVIKGRWGGYHDPTKGLDDWLARVSAQARAAMRGAYRRRVENAMTFSDVMTLTNSVTLPRFQSAVMVDVTFILKRPKATPKTRTPPAIKKPDIDKTVRAVLDAMTDIVYSDDAQVIEVRARKRLADIDETTGAIIKVTSNVEA